MVLVSCSRSTVFLILARWKKSGGTVGTCLGTRLQRHSLGSLPKATNGYGFQGVFTVRVPSGSAELPRLIPFLEDGFPLQSHAHYLAREVAGTGNRRCPGDPGQGKEVSRP